MRDFKFKTIFLIAIIALSTSATAQTIYKCGNTYSENSCPGGVIIPAALTPDPAQKMAADQATRRDALAADQMEKARLQQEKSDRAANTSELQKQTRPPETATATDMAVLPSFRKYKIKRKLQDFRALVPEAGAGTATATAPNAPKHQWQAPHRAKQKRALLD